MGRMSIYSGVSIVPVETESYCDFPPIISSCLSRLGRCRPLRLVCPVARPLLVCLSLPGPTFPIKYRVDNGNTLYNDILPSIVIYRIYRYLPLSTLGAFHHQMGGSRVVLCRLCVACLSGVAWL